MTFGAHPVISSWRVQQIKAMLCPVELTMSTATHFNLFRAVVGLARPDRLSASWPGFRRVATIVVLLAFIALVQAQNAVAPLKAQSAPETLPPAPVASTAKPEVRISAFNSYQRPTQLSSPVGYGFDLANRAFINPFQPAASFGNLPGSMGTLPFNRVGSLGTTRQGASGFNQLGSFGMGRGQGNPGILFQPSSVTGPFGIAPQPSLNQLMRGSFNLPFGSFSSGSSASSAFRFQYSSVLTSAGNLNDLAHPNSSALFTSSDLGGGVFLSAGTYNSGHSTAGVPIMPAGSGTGAPKHSASGVAIKLSF
jgi:hypothetical protein